MNFNMKDLTLEGVETTTALKNDDVYLIKVTTWQCVTKSISILMRNNNISTRWNQSEMRIYG
jgi:hypothetical protein